jgi:heterodisulfide reductase subunit C
MPKALEPIKMKREAELREAFLKEVIGMPHGEKIKNCIQCGTCTGTCPVSRWMDITPRQVVAFFRAGMIEEILSSRTIWICASCYACRVRCPSGIKVTETIYALKRLAIEKKIFPKKFPVHVLSETFVSNLQKYGRNFEMGLGIRYLLATNPTKLLSTAGFGLSMMKRGRLATHPTKIKKVHEVRAIIARAKELEGK